MNKNLLKSLLFVGATASTCFLLWKMWKIGREMNHPEVSQIEVQAHRDAWIREHPDAPDDPETPQEASESLVEVSGEDIEPDTVDLDYEEMIAGEVNDDAFTPEEKEMEELRYPINSKEAFDQFKQIMLADFVRPSDAKYRDILMMLFDFKFTTQIEEDDSIIARCMDYRADFFGDESEWTEKCTVTDVIMDMARNGAEDLGTDDIPTIAKMIVKNLGITTQMDRFEVRRIIKDVETCDYMFMDNGKTKFGMFGLTGHEMTDSTESIMQQYWDWSSKMINF